MIFSTLQLSPQKVRAAAKSPTETTYKGEGYEVNFKVTSSWTGAFNTDVTIKNTGDAVIDNWAIDFSMPYEITNIWNGVVKSKEDGTYVIKNAGSNQDIAAGNSVSFGFSAKATGEIILPDKFDMLCYEEVVAQDKYEVSFRVTSDWGQAFNGEITIKNVSDEAIEDWKLEFDFDRKIDRFWTANIIKNEGNHYSIKNAGYNANINPGQSVTLGFSGSPGNVKVQPLNYQLSQIVTTPSKVDLEKDTDSDGLPDFWEKQLGTSITKTDTDGDGLSDYEEVYLSATDPLKLDTDNNGINDGDEDADKDGLSNLQEKKLGAKINVSDTDSDGIKDGEEVNKYGTSPVKVDTDEDTLTDYEEVTLGLDPLKPMTDGATPDAKRTFAQTLGKDSFEEALVSGDELITPSISGNVSGLIDKNVAVKTSDNKSFNSNRAVLGKVVDIQTKYTEANFTLNYNVSKIVAANGENYAKDLVICKVDGDSGLTPIDTKYEAKNIKADITQGGNYLVLNANDFLRNLGIDVLSNIESSAKTALSAEALSKAEEQSIDTAEVEPHTTDNNADYKPATYKPSEKSNEQEVTVAPNMNSLQVAKVASESTMGIADITFVIDATGSMGDEINNVAKNITSFAEQLVNGYNVNANFAVVEYQDITYDGDSSTIVHKNGASNWFSMYDVGKFKTVINSIYAKGGGDTPETAVDGIETARRLDWRTNASKFIILVTDADSKDNNRYGVASMEDEINLLIDDNIITSVITSSYYQSFYKNLYLLTSGIYADIYGNFAQELLKLADKIGKDTNKGKWVILDDYQVVRLNDPEEDPDGDTDDDGIKDYDELGSQKTVSIQWAINKVRESNNILPTAVYNGKTSVDVYNYSSNPVLVDTDYDGLDDSDSRDLVKRDNGSVDGNAFSGKLFINIDGGVKVNFNVDYTDFFDENNTSYHKDLSVLGSIYSSVVYHNNLNLSSGANLSGQVKEIFEGFGLKDFKDYSLNSVYDDDDLSEIAVGHRLVEYEGSKKDIIVVAVRGTNSTIQEWSSNFDVGADTDNYWDRSNPFWRNKDNHKGFDVAANRLYDYITNYVKTNVKSDAQKVIYITGHSRGAGISNILGKMFEDKSEYQTYTYTFAAPNTTTASNALNYSTIFNVVNSDDIIPQLPLTAWNFKKYGKTAAYTISVESNYEDSNPFSDKVGTYEWLTGQDYNNDGGTSRTLEKFGLVATDRDQIYEFDNSDDGVVNPHNKYHTTYAGAAAELEDVKKELKEQRLDKYSKAYIDEGVLLDNVLVRYKPAFLMQVLANMTCGVGPMLGYDVKGKYTDAKRSFVLSSGKIPGVGGMFCPHYQETYYLIATNNFMPLK